MSTAVVDDSFGRSGGAGNARIPHPSIFGPVAALSFTDPNMLDTFIRQTCACILAACDNRSPDPAIRANDQIAVAVMEHGISWWGDTGFVDAVESQATFVYDFLMAFQAGLINLHHLKSDTEHLILEALSTYETWIRAFTQAIQDRPDLRFNSIRSYRLVWTDITASLD